MRLEADDWFGASSGRKKPRASSATAKRRGTRGWVTGQARRTPTRRRAAPCRDVGGLAGGPRSRRISLPGERRGLQGLRGAGEVAQRAPLRTRTAEAGELSAVGQGDGPSVGGWFEDQPECVHERPPGEQRLRYE